MQAHYTNEWNKLTSVMLHVPRPAEFEDVDPETAMFQEKPSYNRVARDVDRYAEFLERWGVTVYTDEGVDFDPRQFKNLIFMRDLAVVGDGFVTLANPKYPVRYGEQYHLKLALEQNGFDGEIEALPFLDDDELEEVTMEGADFMWITPFQAVVSVGNRTNAAFVDEFAKLHPEVEIHLIHAQPERIPQHMLGCKHIVGPGSYLSRDSVNSFDLPFLGEKFKLNETAEVTAGYSMNVVTLNNKEIVMPAGNSDTRSMYEHYGIRVHEVPVPEIGKMGGSLACMTLPLTRDEI